MIVRVELLHEHAKIPVYAHTYDAGADLYACEDVTIAPRETMRVRTGIAIELLPGYEAQVRPRSSLSAQGVIVALGTIDAGYRGEVMVTVSNHKGWPHMSHEIKRGDRIAQIVVAPVTRVDWRQASGALLALDDRGAGGHGSTGR